MTRKILSWLLVFLWSGVIFYFSNIPHLRIEELGIWDFVLRKLAHITEYAVLCILYIRAFKNTTKFSIKKIYLLSFVFSVLYAITDEIHQSFVPGRSCNIIDLFFDTTGVILGSVVYKNLKLM